MKSNVYLQDRKIKRIWVEEWGESSLIIQGNLCKHYDIILTKNKISSLDNALMKFDVRNFKPEHINQGIEIINKNVSKLSNGIEKFNNIIGGIGNSVGKIGIQNDSKNDPLKNLFGKNKFDLKF